MALFSFPRKPIPELYRGRLARVEKTRHHPPSANDRAERAAVLGVLVSMFLFLSVGRRRRVRRGNGRCCCSHPRPADGPTSSASDSPHAWPLTLVAGIGHWRFGASDWHLMGVPADWVFPLPGHRVVRQHATGDGTRDARGPRPLPEEGVNSPEHWPANPDRVPPQESRPKALHFSLN